MLGAFLNAPIGALGSVSEFKGKQQYQFSELFLLDPEKYPISGFIQSSPIPIEQMEKEFRALVVGCRPAIRDFLEKVFSGDTWRRFREAPAAVTMHHAYVHGLIEHTLSVTKGARALAQTYIDSGVDGPDVVTAGALHDIGKIDSYRRPLPR